MKKIIASILISMLAGCGGGGDSGPVTSSTSVLTDIQNTQNSGLYPNVFDTNKVYALSGVNQNNSKGIGLVVDHKSFRWNIDRDGLIPIIYDTTHKDVYDQAMTNIEKAVGKTLFDRTKYVNSGITFSQIATTLHVRGILLGDSLRTSNGDCGITSWPAWIDTTYSIDPPQPADWNSLVIPATETVFVSFNNGTCQDSVLTAQHEISHALGMPSHINGFGIGGAEKPDYYLQVLKAIYDNPPGTNYSEMIL